MGAQQKKYKPREIKVPHGKQAEAYWRALQDKPLDRLRHLHEYLREWTAKHDAKVIKGLSGQKSRKFYVRET